VFKLCHQERNDARLYTILKEEESAEIKVRKKYREGRKKVKEEDKNQIISCHFAAGSFRVQGFTGLRFSFRRQSLPAF
jgi:hypothetical protein